MHLAPLILWGLKLRAHNSDLGFLHLVSQLSDPTLMYHHSHLFKVHKAISLPLGQRREQHHSLLLRTARLEPRLSQIKAARLPQAAPIRLEVLPKTRALQSHSTLQHRSEPRLRSARLRRSELILQLLALRVSNPLNLTPDLEHHKGQLLPTKI